MANAIVVDRKLKGKAPAFAGTRVPIKNVFDCLEEGDSLEVFLGQFPSVSHEIAMEVIEQAYPAVTEQEQVAMVQLLHTPAQPTRAMKDLMALPDLPHHST